MQIYTRLIQSGVVGSVLLAGVLLYPFEGEVHKTYPDPVGVLTACVGHTSPDLKLGQHFTELQCTDKLIKDLNTAYQGVLRCTPGLPEGMYPSLISFAFNAGVGAYCKSTLAKKAKAKDYIGACKELRKWVYSGSTKLPGLVQRREAEAAHCLAGLVQETT